ncbi:MAG: helix-turn-helix domain-containing protein [Candidatus Ornithomonoglobus sp.]
MPEVKMMKLKEFREVYGMPENTVRQLINSKGFPSYFLGGRWYVDIPKFLRWREEENARNRKYI